MQFHHKRMTEILAAASAGWVGYLTNHAHDIIGGITFVGSAIVVILSGISLTWDLLNKRRERRERLKGTKNI